MKSDNNFLTRLFGVPEEINGSNRCPTYLYRWIVYPRPKPAAQKVPGDPGPAFKIYLHKFVGDDWSRDLHDHPKRFVTVGLWGSYIEETPQGMKIWRAPWIRSFSAEHIHRLALRSRVCWTLVIVFRTVREWGFWHEGRFMPWRPYVNNAGGIADKMKACD